MAIKLSDLPIDDLRKTLRATEAAAGTESISARIIRRELQQKEKLLMLSGAAHIEKRRGGK